MITVRNIDFDKEITRFENLVIKSKYGKAKPQQEPIQFEIFTEEWLFSKEECPF